MRHEPRVLFIAQRLALHDGRFIKTAKSFEDAGYNVCAIAPAGVTPSHPRVEEIAPRTLIANTPGIPTQTRAYLRARDLRHTMVARGRALNPDVIVAYDPETLPAAVDLKRRSGAALIYDAHEFHEDEDPSAPARGAWVRRAELRYAKALDGFVTVNDSIANLYRDQRPNFPESVVVTNAVDPRPSHSTGRLHRRANLPEDAKIILYQGALAPMRGLERLTAAARELEAPWWVVLMGSGPLEDELRARADPDRVRFVPPVDHAELSDWTADATLGALLYEDVGLNQRYCTPNKLWEYPAAGAPILASDLPEVARTIQTHGIGFLVPADAPPKAIARAIIAITPEALARARDHAATFAASHTWSRSVAPLITLADRLARRLQDS